MEFEYKLQEVEASLLILESQVSMKQLFVVSCVSN